MFSESVHVRTAEAGRYLKKLVGKYQRSSVVCGIKPWQWIIGAIFQEVRGICGNVELTRLRQLTLWLLSDQMVLTDAQPCSRFLKISLGELGAFLEVPRIFGC